MEKLIILLGLFSLVGCFQRKTIEEEKFREAHQFVNSINGEVIYVYDQDHSKIVSVFKPKYFAENGLFRVGINRDTIILGDELKGEVYSFNSKVKMRVKLDEPFSKSYEQSDKSRVVADVTFKPAVTGIFSFSGMVEFNNEEEAFEYKFIVVEKP
ncbi:MAG: hypothetical protein RIA63_10410 [Cyclobacteriaceae bacterium]